MRVEFKSEGGIAHFPGLSQPIIIDTAALSGEESRRLSGLVAASGFFDLPPTVDQPRPGAADYRRYIITITDGPRHQSVQVYDPIHHQELRSLVDYLKAKSRRQF